MNKPPRSCFLVIVSIIISILIIISSVAVAFNNNGKLDSFKGTESIIDVDNESSKIIDLKDHRDDKLDQYTITIDKPLSELEINELQSEGIEIINYMGGNSYRVIAISENIDKITSFNYINELTDYNSQNKYSDDIELGKVSVISYGKPDILKYYNNYGTQKMSSKLFSNIINIDSNYDLYTLSKSSRVLHIQQYYQPKLMDETSSEIVGGYWTPNTPYGGPGNYANELGYSGTGVTVGICDTGIGDGTTGDSAHQDFTGRVIGGIDYSAQGTWHDGYGHGTHCAGLVAGNTYNGRGTTYGNTSYLVGQGVAPEANLFSQKIFDDSGTYANPNFDVLFQDANENGVYVHSNSWGASSSGDYIDNDVIYDIKVRDSNSNLAGDQPMVITVSAGNSGPNEQTTGSPGNAKNVITVGATENYHPDCGSYGNSYISSSGADNPDDIADFSSRGWTEDDRIKPDVVAPGRGVLSTRSPDGSSTLYGIYTGDSNYLWCSGTSMSNPVVAGTSAVVVNWYNSIYGVNPSPAMVKALLVNTAQDLDDSHGNTGPIPNPMEGWGRAYLPAIVDSNVDKVLKDQETPLQHGDLQIFSVEADETNKPLNFTLTWTDAPSDTTNSIHLMNDLDIKIFDPEGNKWYGNSFKNGMSQLNTASDWDYDGDKTDDRNNVVNIFIPKENVTSGLYTVQISGKNISIDGIPGTPAVDQDFAFVAYNAKISEGDIPSIGVYRPSKGMTWVGGETRKIKWDTMGGNGTITVDLEYSTDDGNTWTTIDTNLPNTGVYDWTLPNEDSTSCRIMATVKDGDGDINYTVSGQFEITPIKVDILYPDGLEVLLGNTTEDILWNTTGGSSPIEVDIWYSLDNGNNWNIIDSNIPDNELYSWNIINQDSSEALIKINVTDSNLNTYEDISQSTFKILKMIDAPYTFTFESGSLENNWTASNPDKCGVGSHTSNSGSYSMYTRWSEVETVSRPINTSSLPLLELSYWLRIGDSSYSDAPEPGELLEFYYLNDNDNWILRDSFDPYEFNIAEIKNLEYTLPSDALHDGFRMKFRQTGGSGEDFDYWHIDDIEIKTPPPYRMSINPTDSVEYADAGQTISHNFTVTNSGLNPDTYDLTGTGNSWPVQFYDSTGINPITSLTVNSSSSKEFIVKVTIPSDANPGESDSVLVNVSSQNDNTVFSNVNAATATSYSGSFFDDFETDQNWTISGGEWERGTPQGLGGSTGNPDPSTAFSGTNVMGYDLTSDGDYENGLTATYWVTSPIIDFSGTYNVSLKFERWLGVESYYYDSALIEVYDGSNWVSIWENGASSISDTAWTQLEYDISAYADDNSQFQIRFGIGPTDGSVTYCGWNIDDISIGSPTPYNFDIDKATSIGYGNPGKGVNHTISLTNTGTADDTYDITITNNSWPTQTYDSSGTTPVNSISIPKGSSGTIMAKVNIPNNASKGDFDEANIIFTSQNDSSISDSITINSGLYSKLANSSWPVFQHDLNHTGQSEYDTSQNEGDFAWSYLTGNWVRTSPVIDSNNKIYFGSDDGNVYCLYPDGSYDWSYPTGDIVWSNPSLSDDGTLYIGSRDGYLYSLTTNGGLQWTFDTGAGIKGGSIIGDNGIIYFGDMSGKFYALNPDGSERWNFTTGAAIYTTPAIDNSGNIFFGSQDNNLYSVNPNGTLRWNYTTGGEVNSSPSIDNNGTIYFGSTDSNLYALYPNGSMKWTFTTGDAVGASPAISTDGTIYIGSRDNYLYSINQDGNENWNYLTGGDVISSPILGVEGTVYFGSEDDSLYALNPDGNYKWSYSTLNYIRSSGAIDSNGDIYIGSLDSRLYKLTGTPPSALSTDPFNGETDVELGRTVEVIFNEEMNSSVIPTLTQTAGVDPGGWSFLGWSTTNVINDTARWSHNDWIPDNTIYINVSGFEDDSGNLGQSYEWSFITTSSYSGYISPTSISKMGSPGDIVYYNLNITNDGLSDDTYNITVANNNWPVQIYDETRSTIIDQIFVNSNSSKNFSVEVSIPVGVGDGASDTVDISVTSQNDTSVTDTSQITTIVPFQIPWEDDFEFGNIGGSTGFNWSTSNSLYSGVSSYTSNSGIYSMYTEGTSVYVTSYYINLSSESEVELSCWIRRGDDTFSENPDTGEDLRIQYIDDDGVWNTLDTFLGSGTAGEIYEMTYELPSDALHNRFQVRFYQTGGSGSSYDYWHIDDVNISTPPPYVFSIDKNQYLGYGNPGDTVSHHISITNTGTENDTYDISIVNNSWNTEIYDSNGSNLINSISVDSGSTGNIMAKVDIPPSASKGDFDLGELVLLSQNDTSVSDNSYIRTQLYAVLANSSWPMFRHDLNHTGQSDIDTSHTDGSEIWSVNLGNTIHSSPAIGPNGTVYIGCWDSQLYAFSPGGLFEWSYPTGGGTSSPAIADDGTIYVGSYDNMGLYALHDNGTLKWNINLGSYVYSSPTIGPNGTIYIGSDSNNFYAINPNGTIKWSYPTAGDVRSSAAINSDGIIYIGSADNNLYALYPNGTLKWSYSTGGVVYSSPAVASDGTIYVGSNDGYLYALNPNGSFKWNFASGGSFGYSSPGVSDDGTIYFGSRGDTIYALNPDGTEKWNYLTGGDIRSSPAIGSEGTIYIGSLDNSLYAIKENGTLKWRYTAFDGFGTAPSIGPYGDIYAASLNDIVYRLGDTPPTVVNTDPLNGETDVQLNRTVEIIFDEEMNSSVTPTLTQTAGTDPGGWTFLGWSSTLVNNDTVRWSHNSWNSNSNIQLEISNFEDTFGTSGTPYSWSFQTIVMMEVNPSSSVINGNPGQVISHNFQISNNGVSQDTYDVYITNNSWATQIYDSTGTIPISYVTINSSQSKDIIVKVAVPGSAKKGDEDVSILNVVSQNDTSISDTSTLKTLYSERPTNVALFKTDDPWGYTSNEDVLNNYSIPYDIYGTADIGSIDLSIYDKVIIVGANGQDAAFYTAISTYKTWFENYTDNGGVLEIHVDDWGDFNDIPCGIVSVYANGNSVNINKSENNMLNIPHNITLAELQGWGSSYHRYFTDYPSQSEVVLTEGDTGNEYAILLEAKWGNGTVIASGQTLEWAHGYDYSNILDNIILYMGKEYDEIQPFVNYTIPQDGDSDVPIGQNVEVVFSETMDTSVIPTISQISGTDPGGWTFQSWSSTTTNNDTAIWSHNDWGSEDDVTLEITNYIDLAGNYGNPYQWNFTVEDIVPPIIESTNPLDDSSDVSISQYIVIEFNESMNTSIIPTLLQTNGTDPGGWSFVGWSTSDIPDDTATWAHNNWVIDDNITLNITNYVDLGGNTGAPYSWNFTTELLDTTQPDVFETTPPNGDIEVLISEDIGVIFTENMNTSVTPTINQISGTDPGGWSFVGWSSTYKENDTATWTHNDFNLADSITLNITDYADEAGNYGSGYEWSFITDTPPDVLETIPTGSASSVVVDQNVVVLFNESMNSSITPTLTQTAGTDPGGWTFLGWSSTYIKNDTASWGHDDWSYLDSITLNITNYQDTTGNMGMAFNWSFVTEDVDIQQPVVESTLPTNGEIDVLIDQNVNVVFNETMNTSVTPTLVQTTGTNPGGWMFIGWTSTNVQNDTAIWIHNDWSYGESITLNITNYEDIAGNIGPGYEWSFITDEQPNVLSTSPINGASSALINQNVIVTFSESMDTSIIPSLNQIGGTDPGGWTFVGWSTTNIANDTATWVHNDWESEDNVILRVTNYQDLNGYSGNQYTWSFTIEDSINPTVIEVTPSDGSIGIGVGQDVVIVFSETMDTSVTPTLLQTNGTNTGGWTFQGWSTTYTIDDTATWIHNDWNYNETITLNITGYEDEAGNSGDVFQWSFTTEDEDTSPPQLSITNPSNGSLLDSSQVLIEWSVSDPESGVDYNEIRIDGGSWIIIGSSTQYYTDILSDGEHLIEVRSTNNIGLENTDDIRVTIDTNGPVVTIINPEDGSIITDDIIVVEWSGTDELSGIDHYEIILDSEDPINTRFDEDYEFRSLDEGTHTILITSYDMLGNTGTVEITFTVDTVRPNIDILSPEEGSYHMSSGTFVWSGDDVTSGVQFYEFKIDDNSWVNVGLNTQVTLSELGEGEHIFRARITDNAGITSTDSNHFFVDITPPTIVENSPTGDNVEIDTLIEITFSEQMLIDSVQITSDGITGVLSWNNNTLILEPEVDLAYDTTYTIIANGTDLAGNQLEEYEWSFTTTNNGIITGRVVDGNGDPISGATVTVGDQTTTTDQSGYFEIETESGSKAITISKDGYYDKDSTLELNPGDTENIGQVTLEDESDEGFGIPWWIILIIIIVTGIVLTIYYLHNRNKRKYYQQQYGQQSQQPGQQPQQQQQQNYQEPPQQNQYNQKQQNQPQKSDRSNPPSQQDDYKQ